MIEGTMFGRVALAVSLLFAPGFAVAQSRQAAAPPAQGSYGPRVVTEHGYTVYVPRHCYVSREQVRSGGQLVWRPLVTCPFDDYR